MNLKSYNKVASLWNENRRGHWGREQEYLDLVLHRLPAGSTILDLGCGTGTPMGRYIISKGHHVIGVDQSDRMLGIARDQFPQQTWIQSRMEEFQPTAPFDAAILWDSLFHIARDQHEAILKKIAHHLPASARLMLTVGGSAHPAFTDFMYGEEFFYDSHPPIVSVKFRTFIFLAICYHVRSWLVSWVLLP